MSYIKQITSCGIAPFRVNSDNKIEILLGQPTASVFFGYGFLKGQVEDNETLLEAAKREFAEESGGIDVELFGDDVFFEQETIYKKIRIYPAMIETTKNNDNKIDSFGNIKNHDDENTEVRFFQLDSLPLVFKNQQKILDNLIDFINVKLS